MCKKRISTMGQLLDHLANEVMPELIERLSVGVLSFECQFGPHLATSDCLAMI
jgi:hypothetical protein